MSDVARASNLIREVLPREHRSIGEWMRDTYRTLQRFEGRWSIGRTESIWYATARRIDAWEMDSIRLAKRYREIRTQDAADKLERARAEYRALTADRNSRLAAAYSNTDPDFHRPQLDALAAIAARWIAPEIAEGDDEGS